MRQVRCISQVAPLTVLTDTGKRTGPKSGCSLTSGQRLQLLRPHSGSRVKIQGDANDAGQSLESKPRKESRNSNVRIVCPTRPLSPTHALLAQARGWAAAGRCPGARWVWGVLSANFRTDPWVWARQCVWSEAPVRP